MPRFHGKSPRLQTLGFVADYCPVCRQLTTGVASQLCLDTHRCFIRVAQGQPVGTVVRCDSCRTNLWRPLAFYRTTSPHRLEAVELLSRTNPFPLGSFESRMAIDAGLERASAEIRAGMLCDTLQRLSYGVARITSSGEVLGAGHIARCERVLARALAQAQIADAANPQMLARALGLAAQTGSVWAAAVRADRIASAVAGFTPRGTSGLASGSAPGPG